MAISSDVIRGYNDTMILYLLLDQPSYGYEISRQIKTLSHEKYNRIEETRQMKNILSRRPRSILRLHVWRKMAISHLFRIRTLQPANAVPTTRSLAKGVLTIRKNVRNGCLRRKL